MTAAMKQGRVEVPHTPEEVTLYPSPNSHPSNYHSPSSVSCCAPTGSACPSYLPCHGAKARPGHFTIFALFHLWDLGQCLLLPAVFPSVKWGWRKVNQTLTFEDPKNPLPSCVWTPSAPFVQFLIGTW